MQHADASMSLLPTHFEFIREKYLFLKQSCICQVLQIDLVKVKYRVCRQQMPTRLQDLHETAKPSLR
jgi:hypothetical protein